MAPSDQEDEEDMQIHAEVPVLTEAIVIGKQDYMRLADLLLSAHLRSRPAEAPEVLAAFERKLGRAVVTDGPVPATTVAIGSTVVVRDMETDDERTVALVWPGEERSPDRISVLTLFGSTLLGLPAGSEACYRAPDGRPKRLVVRAVSEPETSPGG